MAGLPRHVRLLLALSKRELPVPACDVTVEYGLKVPAGLDVTLIADHYIPGLNGPRPTVLVRTPYGRGFPWNHLYGALFARQGFHVLIQSCRGTGGSGGELEPFVGEAADGQATVAWLREQPWFDGKLATVGASYLGYVQWALAADPPSELRAMIPQVSMEAAYPLMYPGGAFALAAILTATAAMLSMERGFPRFLAAMTRVLRHYKRIARTLPLIDAYPAAFGRGYDPFEEWITRPDSGDPYWDARRVVVHAELAPPTSLLTGWWDIGLDTTLDAYRRLRAAGREVRLTIGPWNHASGFSDRPPVAHAEALRWLRAHLDGDRDALPAQPVRVHVSEAGGRGEWRDLPDWPLPEAVRQQWHLSGDGDLAQAEPERISVSRLRYDPANPTPSVGGPILDSWTFGSRRNNTLESRDDVLVFTSAPLGESAEVIGTVSIRLRVRASGPHFDVFARLCDVDERGRSWNVCDGILRRGPVSSDTSDSSLGSSDTSDSSFGSSDNSKRPTGGAGGAWVEITVPMSAAAHRFAAGHRLRVQVSGGAHPRFMRNTGTGESPGTATRLVPVTVEFGHGPGMPSVLTLPVVATQRRPAPGLDRASANP